MNSNDNGTSSQAKSEVVNLNDYDRLDIKHTPGNKQDDELKSLQERLEQYKKDPVGTPWESAFEKLLHPTAKTGSDVC